MMSTNTVKNVGIAGTGALGSIVAKALIAGIGGYELIALSDTTPNKAFNLPYVGFEELAESCDLIVECLPASAVPDLCRAVFAKGKDLVLISSCALLIYPEILESFNKLDPVKRGRIIVPSGALTGLDGVKALKELGIKSAKIASTKAPTGFAGAPYIVENGIDLAAITQKTCLFKGNALKAASGFPANVNVAATLSLAHGIGPEFTQVEIWADPDAKGNQHELEVIGEFSTISSRISNKPDPDNPKSSVLAGASIVSALRGLSEPLAVLT